MTMDSDHVPTLGRSIGAGDFKATCLKVLDEVAQSRTPLIITKRVKPVAKLLPMPPQAVLFGALAGSVVGESDVESPIAVSWDADA